MRPKVSVLMAVHNGERYLREAVESILGQTLTDFEFLVIDDGSFDSSIEILRSYGDKRIRLVSNGENLGLAASLNRGLDIAAGQYIARMDCDDVSLPERLSRQVAFMDSHPEVAACGTWAKEIDEAGNVVGSRRTPVGRRLAYDYWRMSPIIHPSALLRATHLRGFRYDERLRYAQDFDLWFRINAHHKLSNLADYLLLYRVHGESISSTKSFEQCCAVLDAIRRHTAGLEISFEEFLALLSANYELNPIRRAWATRKLSKAIREPYHAYFVNDLCYATTWLSSRLTREGVAAKARAYRTASYVKRRLKHLV